MSASAQSEPWRIELGRPRAFGRGRPGLAALAVGIVAAGVVVSGVALAQAEAPEPLFRALGSLKGLKPPLPNLDRYVRDRDFAIVLGKALFWEQRVGSDGIACASCHFKAGADSRIINQLNPGLLDTRFPDGDPNFGGLVNAPGLHPDDASDAELRTRPPGVGPRIPTLGCAGATSRCTS